MKILDAPALDGWVTISEAAEILGISRQHCWRMAASQPSKWKTLHRIGTSTVYVVRIEEVNRKRDRRPAHTPEGAS